MKRAQTAISRLQDVAQDPTSGLSIGTIEIGSQMLRVGIRASKAGANRPALLLCNGIGANLELVGHFASEMDDFETVIFDVPGTGKSPTPQMPYRLFSIARLATKLLDTLGYTEPVDVLGVSWGGGLAQQLAIQYPGRVRRLILAATAMGGGTMVPGKPHVLMKMVSPKRYSDKGYMHSIAADIYGGKMRTDPKAIAMFTKAMKGGNGLGYAFQITAMLGWTSLPWLWRMTQPTLILAGNDDPLIPLVNPRLQTALMRNARLHIIEDGHLFLLTSADVTAPVIRQFLTAEDAEVAKPPHKRQSAGQAS